MKLCFEVLSPFPNNPAQDANDKEDHEYFRPSIPSKKQASIVTKFGKKVGSPKKAGSFKNSWTRNGWTYHHTTIDGRNPAPVHRLSIPLFTGFLHPRWLFRISSINSSSHLLLMAQKPSGSPVKIEPCKSQDRCLIFFNQFPKHHRMVSRFTLADCCAVETRVPLTKRTKFARGVQ